MDYYHGHPIFRTECINLIQGLDFETGSAIKYLYRIGKKGPAMEDMRKAKWYVTRITPKRHITEKTQEILINRSNHTALDLEIPKYVTEAAYIAIKLLSGDHARLDERFARLEELILEETDETN